jgi:hypothetical protein
METKMDKEFWREIAKNDFLLPTGHGARGYLDELLQNLGSTDPELRDELSLSILSTWLERRLYSDAEMRALLAPMSANLALRLGEVGTDSVFRRTFSVLILAELIHCDNKKSYLTQAEVMDVLEQGLRYLQAEQDARGFVPEKGWAHALAHTSDLLMVLSASRHLGAVELQRILQGIAARLVNSGHTIYINDEDERLIRVIVTIMERDLLSVDTLAAWSQSLVQLNGANRWKEAYYDAARDRARHNVKTFLRSLHYRLVKSGKQRTSSMAFIPVLQEHLKILTPWA